MATKGWGKCSRCGNPHGSLMARGICDDCQEKEKKREMFDRIATPEKLRHHPSLAEAEDYLDEHYPINGDPNA